MDWSQIIITFISSGVFLGLFLIAEKKTKAQMSNMQIMLDNYKEQVKDYSESNKELRKENTELHRKLDASNTAKSIAEMKRCDCITCTNRRPPLGDIWSMNVVDVDDEDNC